MEEQHGQKKTLLIVALIALGVIALLIAVFLIANRKTEREAIVLPEAAPVQQPQVQEPETPALAEVQPENIQAILASLSRPSAYYQVFTVAQFADGKSCSQTVYLWVSGALVHADIVSQEETRSILTDGKTLYLWYDDDSQPVQLRLDRETSMDDLLGIPTYETLLTLPADTITAAELQSVEDTENEGCVYVCAETDGVRQEYRVSLDSGLLIHQTMTQNGQTRYEMEQKTLERLADGDEVFSDIFTLPDGTEPFR